jgi:predicted protein tyrosine phosphatase
MPLYKFTAEFTVRASSRDEAERAVQDELGFDIYEKHIICEEIPDNKESVDMELIKA